MLKVTEMSLLKYFDWSHVDYCERWLLQRPGKTDEDEEAASSRHQSGWSVLNQMQTMNISLWSAWG